MSPLEIQTDALRCVVEEMLFEDMVEAPANLLTSLRLKVTEDDDGCAILTVLRFEVRFDA